MDHSKRSETPSTEMIQLDNQAALSKAEEQQVRALDSLAIVERTLKDTKLNDLSIAMIRMAIMEARSANATVSKALAAVPLQLRQSHNSTARVAKVFGLPELAEMIMMNLELKDLLSMQRVCKTTNLCIRDSVSLQQRLLLLPDPLSESSSLVSLLPDRTCTFSTSACFRDATKTWDRVVTLTAEDPASLGALKFGSRILSMLVCQPPILEMQLRAGCKPPLDWLMQLPKRSRFRNIHILTLSSGEGLTLRELLDGFAILEARHCWCPSAAAAKHDELGRVRAAITAQGSIGVSQADPFVAREWTKGTLKEAQILQQREWKTRVDRYTTAKHRSWTGRYDVPTLAEFETVRFYHDEVMDPEGWIIIGPTKAECENAEWHRTVEDHWILADPR